MPVNPIKYDEAAKALRRYTNVGMADNVTELLTDLHHYAAANGLDLDTLFATAKALAALELSGPPKRTVEITVTNGDEDYTEQNHYNGVADLIAKVKALTDLPHLKGGTVTITASWKLGPSEQTWFDKIAKGEY